MKTRIQEAWARFWMRFAGTGRFGRLATGLAGWFYPPYKGRHALVWMSPDGYFSPRATLHHPGLSLGRHVFLGDGVILFGRSAEERVVLGDEVFINKDTIIETGHGGSLVIGNRTTVQPRCQFSAYKGDIRIGEDVQIAPGCAFYPYNHGMSADVAMKQQPLISKDGIHIDDDVWLGYGVVVLDGVHIGKGAVIGAGSVVNQDIPAGVIAAGVPARVIRHREGNTDSSRMDDTSA